MTSRRAGTTSKASDGRRVAGVLWTHGAGSDREHPQSVMLEERLSPLPVRRINFPYRDKPGKRPPDRAPVLLESLYAQLDRFCDELGVGTERIVIGGRSMGGRICSMAVADGLAVAGLVLVSYPLHPPGKPEKLRTEHLPQITVPSLFVSGLRDPFGSPEELQAAIDLIPAETEFHTVKGAHDFKGSDEVVCDLIAAFIERLNQR